MSGRAALVVLLAGLSLVMHLTIAREFERRGAFADTDILFDADTSIKLEALALGRHLGIRHPNLMPYFSPPVALLAQVAAGLGAAGSQPELRREIGTLVVPLAATLETALVLLLFSALGFSLLQATVLALLEMVSFSSLVFGSIPESFGLTAAALAAGFAYAARSTGDLDRKRVLVWILLGVLLTGITISNLALIAPLILVAAWHRQRGLLIAAARTTAILVVVFGLTGASAWLLDRIMIGPKPDADASWTASINTRVLEPSTHAFHRYLAPDPARKLFHFPTYVANSFAPPAVDTKAIRGASGVPGWGFTLENSPSVFGVRDPIGLSVLLLLLAGAGCGVATPSMRPLVLASISIVGVSWLLSTWGRETFLYSQNWHLAALVLLAGVMKPAPTAKLMTAVIGILTLVLAIHNFAILRQMLTMMPVWSR